MPNQLSPNVCESYAWLIESMQMIPSRVMIIFKFQSIPAAYSFMPWKTASGYKYMIQKLITAVGKKPKKALQDFEVFFS